MNTWFDTFQSPNGTNMIGRTSDSGATYANLSGQTLVQMPVESNSPYSASGGSDAYAVASANLGINDPVSMLVTYSGSATTAHCSLLYRIQANGSGYALRFNNLCKVSFFILPGTGVAVASFQPASVLANGQYLLVAAPWFSTHDLYLIQQSTGEYFNPATGSFQAAQIPIVSVGDVTTLAGGSPGINQSYQFGNSEAIAINQVSGGPAIFLPADLGCSLSTDRSNVLTCLSARGGYGTPTYALQRKTGAGSYATIGTPTPGTPFIDTGLVASTTYDYQVVATDSQANTATSAAVAATTTAAQSIRPYTPTTPASPITAWINGTMPKDASGAAGQFHNFSGFYDWLYGQYFGIGQNIGAGPYPVSLDAYFSADVMNWTPSTSNPVITVTQLNADTSGGGVTWAYVARAAILQHPTDAHYYIGFHAFNSGNTVSGLFTYKASTPMGPYTYVAGPINVPGNTIVGDEHLFMDYDGRFWWICDENPGIAQLASTMATFTGNTNTSVPTGFTAYEGDAPYRFNRSVGFAASYQTGFAWNPNQVVLFGSTFQYTSNGSGISNAVPTVWPNASMFTTAAQQIAAPAGAGPATFPNGYGGSGNPYTGGTATGIDPVASYGGQVASVLVTAGGQYILILDRHDSTGTNASTVVWLPITFNANGLPTVPFVASFAPQLSSGGGGAPWVPSSTYGYRRRRRAAIAG